MLYVEGAVDTSAGHSCIWIKRYKTHRLLPDLDVPHTYIPQSKCLSVFDGHETSVLGQRWQVHETPDKEK